jgi:hypothetical protein
METAVTVATMPMYAKLSACSLASKQQSTNANTQSKLRRSKMIEKAIEKLRTEMEASRNDAYVQCIGDYLINIAKSTSGAAERIVVEGKTILGSLEHMRLAASKVKKNNFALITADEAFKLVMEYYGMKKIDPPTPSQEKSKSLNISLDELF